MQLQQNQPGVVMRKQQYLMRDLKIRMKYRGYVMSDWGATHSLSIEKGLDQEMPGNTSFNQESLKGIPENVIDDSVVQFLHHFLGRHLR